MQTRKLLYLFAAIVLVGLIGYAASDPNHSSHTARPDMVSLHRSKPEDSKKLRPKLIRESMPLIESIGNRIAGK